MSFGVTPDAVERRSLCRRQLQVDGGNQQLMHNLLLLWGEREGINLGPDGEEEEGDGSHHLDGESFGLLDILEAAF